MYSVLRSESLRSTQFFLSRQDFRRNFRQHDHAVPDALRGLDRNLLAADRAREREERLAAAHEKHRWPRADDRRHHRVPARERALRAVPVHQAS